MIVRWVISPFVPASQRNGYLHLLGDRLRFRWVEMRQRVPPKRRKKRIILQDTITTVKAWSLTEQNYPPQIMHFPINRKIKVPCPCYQESLLTTLTSSLSYYFYQKDERGRHGNLLTKRRSFFLLSLNSLSLLPWLCPSPNLLLLLLSLVTRASKGYDAIWKWNSFKLSEKFLWFNVLQLKKMDKVM